MEPNNFDQITEMITPGLWMLFNALVLIFSVLATGLALGCLVSLMAHCCLGARDGMRVRATRSPRRSARPSQVARAFTPTASRVR